MKEALLVHGWDPRFYNTKLSSDVESGIAWKDRSGLIKLLNQKYDVRYFNLPGFCGAPEPTKNKFDVEDFTDYLANWIKLKNKPDIIIGYSFGGVVALDYRFRYDSSIPTVLISPALIRSESLGSRIAHLAKNKMPLGALGEFKKYYQYFLSRYYREGTLFLRESYDQIVRRDMSFLLGKVKVDGLLLIYGTNDDTTPWRLVKEKALQLGIEHCLIEAGEHNIGQTHPRKIFEAINDFLKDG